MLLAFHLFIEFMFHLSGTEMVQTDFLIVPFKTKKQMFKVPSPCHVCIGACWFFLHEHLSL